MDTYMDSSPTGFDDVPQQFEFGVPDMTPQAVALWLLFAGGVLYLLKYFGFRFNFGVAAGR